MFNPFKTMKIGYIKIFLGTVEWHDVTKGEATYWYLDASGK